MIKKTPRAIIGLCAIFLVSACNPPPPPMISIEGRDCMTSLDFTLAHPVPLGPASGTTVTLDDKAPCLQLSTNAKSVFELFDLPATSTPYIITVASSPLGQGLFSPHLLLLDPMGKQQREVPRESFLFHGSSLIARIRAHSEERYLVVMSDPQTVGQRIIQTKESARIQNFPLAGGGYLTVHTGSDVQSAVTNAYNGKITVLAEPLPQ